MGNTGFLFPGQGSQYVGMGKDLYEEFESVRELYHRANEVLRFDIASLCFEGPEDELMLTKNTQPAILLTSVAALHILKEKGLTPVCAAGHSLGEYSAFVSSGALTLEDALTLVRKRGTYMQDAVPVGAGGMAAIIGLERAEVEDLCREAQSKGVVEPANYNSPEQTVIAGEIDALEKAVALAKERGAKKAVPLKVSAPFHSSLMTPAAEKLSKDLDNTEFMDLMFPVITNTNARVTTTPDEAREALKKQVNTSLLWVDSMKRMVEEGVDTMIEIGPGKVLCGLMRRIDKNVRTMHAGDCARIAAVFQEIG